MPGNHREKLRFGNAARGLPATHLVRLVLQRPQPGELLQPLPSLLRQLLQPLGNPVHGREGIAGDRRVPPHVPAAGQPLGAFLQVFQGGPALSAQLLQAVQLERLGDLPAGKGRRLRPGRRGQFPLTCTGG